MTQHGSFPGRPRGRRARHEADLPEGEGYDATPPDEREFPDLPPIRPSQARGRDAGGQGNWQGQHAQPGQYERRAGAGSPGRAGTAADTRLTGRATDSPATDSRGPARPAPATGSRTAARSAPGYPGGQTTPLQGGPGRARGRPGARVRISRRSRSRPSRAGPEQQRADAEQGRQEEDVPSWAEPDSVEAFSARWHRRGLDSRGDRRTGRRKRRRKLFTVGGAAAVVVIAVAVYFAFFSSSGGSPNLGLG